MNSYTHAHKKLLNKIQNREYPRMGHRAIAVNNYVLVYGGVGENGQYMKSMLLIDCKSFSCKVVPVENEMEIEGFTMFSMDEYLCIWGGISSQKASNKLWGFNGKKFIQMQQFGDIPERRGFHAYANINKKYILIYGGWNFSQIHHTWHVFNIETKSWINSKPNIFLPFSQHCKLVWQNGRGFLVISQSLDSSHFIIFSVKFTNLKTFQLHLQRIFQQGGLDPTPRSNPSLYLQGTKLYLFGGQLINKQSIQFLNDVWVYNIEVYEWDKTQIQIDSKSEFEIVKIENKLMFIGGIKSKMKLSESIEQFSLNYGEQSLDSTCSICLYPFQSIKRQFQKVPEYLKNIEEPYKQRISISSQFIRKISENFQDCFHGLFFFIKTLIAFSPEEIKFKIVQIEQNPKYFKIYQNYLEVVLTQSSLNRSQVSDLVDLQECYDYGHPKWNNLAIDFKVGALAFGKSYLFVCKTISKHIYISFLSSNTLQSTYNQSINLFFSYTISPDKKVSSKNDQHIIKQNISNFISEAEYTMLSPAETKIYIFDPSSEYKQILLLENHDESQQRKIQKITEWANIFFVGGDKNKQILPKIWINDWEIRYESMKEFIRKWELDGKLKKIKTTQFIQSQCKHIRELGVYSVHSFYWQNHLKDIFIYNSASFITKIPSKHQQIWAYAILSQQVNVSILQDRITDKQTYSQISSFLENHLSLAHKNYLEQNHRSTTK